VHLSNGMTRGMMGFGNWIPVVVYGREGVSLYQPQQDATAVPVLGDMPEHPSPKPLRAMTWILSRFRGDSVIDPFAGSGTTLVAAKQLGWSAVGIEREERFCEIAVRRLQQDVLPLGVLHDD
jgi:site-specific DNA-methyltransferase (adenine-specific)